MLAARLAFGFLLVAVLVGLCWLDLQAARPGSYLIPLAAVLALLAASELAAMFRKRGHQPPMLVIYGSVMLTVLSSGFQAFAPGWAGIPTLHGLQCLAIGLAAALVVAIIGELRRFNASGTATMNLAFTSLAVLYIGGLMGFLVQLRLLSGPPWGAGGRWGMVALVSLIATVKMSDVGQYTVGRLFGRQKLSPTISPGKTWEGAAGGIIVAIATAWLVFQWAAEWIIGNATGPGTMRASTSALAIVAFAIAVAVTGMLGDLAESMLKRDAGVKDSSEWLPGFGGVLDLLDSLLLAAPVAYVFWSLHWVGP